MINYAERVEQLNKEDAEQIEKFFPNVSHGLCPLGSKILIQGMFVEAKSKGGIIIPDQARKEESYNIAIGRVVALGQLAYCDKDSGAVWSEGRWVNVGDIVYVPRTGYRIEREIDGNKYSFVLLADIEVVSKIDSLDGLALFKL